MKNILLISFLFIIILGCNSGNESNNSSKSGGDTTNIKTGEVKSGDVTLFYKSVGQGTPIVVIGDGPGFVHNYLPQYFNSLAKKFQVIYFDQRGNGKSSFPKDSSFTLNNYLQDIAALQKQLNIDKINLIGHSFGAFLAEVYAANYPDKINSLVLSDPLPMSSLALQQDEKKAQSKRSDDQNMLLVKTMRSKDFKNGSPETFKKAYKMLQEINVKDSATLAQLFDHIKFTPQEAKNYLLVSAIAGKILLNYNLMDTLHQIKAKTLILHGAMDNVTLDDMQDLQNAIPYSELDIIGNSVHYSFAGNSDDYFRQLNLFYDKVFAQDSK